jgi:hypothetical protein
MKLTKKQFENLLEKNPKLKIAQDFGGYPKIILEPIESIKNLNQSSKNNKIIIEKEKKTKNTKKILLNSEINSFNLDKKEKKVQSSTYLLNKTNLSSIIQTSSSHDHFSVLFDGAKLLSVNQIFAILQYRKYEIFTYKKTWHNLIINALNIEQEKNHKKLPFFDDAVEIILFRQAQKLVDEDAITTMFKFIIDGFKFHPEKNPLGILQEDNPKIVHKISCYSEKGVPIVGIKIQRCTQKKNPLKALDLL